MSLDSTKVTVRNPSATATLTVSMQGQLPRQIKRFYDFVDDVNVGSMQPKGLGSIGGGQVQDDRRIVLIADAPTAVEIVSRSSDFVVEQLKLIEYTDAPASWDVARELSPVKAGVTYLMDKDTRISFRINAKSSLEGAYLNFKNLGEANVRIIYQTEREMYRTTRNAVWTVPVQAGDVAPGSSREFKINDTSRLVVSTDSEKELALEFANTNMQHTLRLLNVDDEGCERVVASIGHGQSQVAGTGTNGIHAPGLNLQSGRVTISRGVSAIIAQAPQ